MKLRIFLEIPESSVDIAVNKFCPEMKQYWETLKKENMGNNLFLIPSWIKHEFTKFESFNLLHDVKKFNDPKNIDLPPPEDRNES